MLEAFENESKRIKERMMEIRKNKENPPLDRKIVITNGDPILEQDVPEYTALKVMEDILDNKTKSKPGEYLEARSWTKLEDLDKKDREIFADIEYYKKQIEIDIIRTNEKKRIVEEMKRIEGNYVKKTGFAPSMTANNGRRILKSDEKEYKALIGLLEIISTGYKEDNFEEYMNKRNQTNLPKMSDEDYSLLVGKDQISIGDEPTEETTTDIEAAEIEVAQNNKVLEEQQQSTTELQSIKDNNNVLSGIPNPNYTSSTLVADEILDLNEPTSNLSNRLDEEPEELYEVVRTTPWELIKDHKKQIIIALGITAITISAVVLVTQVLPAIAAANQANQVVGLASSMIKNSSLWSMASPSEQLALHSANKGLASAISNLTGITSNFTNASGLWSFGTQSMTEFMAQAATNAVTATKTAAELSSTASLIGGLGLGTIIGGVISDQKSREFKRLNKRIRTLLQDFKTISNDELVQRLHVIHTQITTSTDLNEKERNILLTKLKRAINRIKKMNPTNKEVSFPETDNVEVINNIDDYINPDTMGLSSREESLDFNSQEENEKEGYSDNIKRDIPKSM